MCLRRVRLQFQCAAVRVGGLVQLPLDLERIAQVVVCRDVVRLQFQCPAVAADGLVQLALGRQRIAQVGMKDSIGSLQLDRPSDMLGGDRVLAHLAGDDSKQVERIGMIRLGGENLAVDLLGSLKSPLLMVPDSNR